MPSRPISRIVLLFVIFLVSIAAIAQANGRATTEPTISTSYGQIHGVILPDHGSVNFLGIPYAQPPVGDLRWHEPVRRSPGAEYAKLRFGASSAPSTF